MRRVELMKQRHDLKIALKRARNDTRKKDSTTEGDYPLTKQKDKTRIRLRRNLKKAALKNALRRSAQVDPCTHDHSGDELYTFSNPNCYNQLDEVVVFGKKKKPQYDWGKPNTMKNLTDFEWWDGSIEDPWPDWKWDWFEDRQSGDWVWGSVGGWDTGRKLGKDGKIYNSYQGDDLVPWGGGAKLKFWSHLDNYWSFLRLGLKDGGKTVKHGHKMKDVYDDIKIPMEVSNDTIINFSTYKPESTYKDPFSGEVKAVYSNFNKRDTTIIKSQLKNFQRFLQEEKIKHQKEVDDILNGKKSID